MPNQSHDHQAQTCFTIDRARQHSLQTPAPPRNDKVPPQVFAMMAVTTLATFGTLTSGYTLLF